MSYMIKCDCCGAIFDKKSKNISSVEINPNDFVRRENYHLCNICLNMFKRDYFGPKVTLDEENAGAGYAEI